MTSKQIRQQFLDFFASKEHTIVDSSPVVPLDDPTLMFTNAGMNQFKDVFLATGSRPYSRAADTQKCIRAGGKHNDLDDVGQDTYHHTFFEMLGNWAFGDYFKKEAIAWAWELMTEVWGIDKTRLHATYFEGDKAEGLEPDSEAAELWKSVTDINPDNVHPGNKKDNFWEMGDTGPCGPCSEIHIDLTPEKSGASLVNAGDARVIELWNLVFIQYNRGADGKLTPLPAKHVDTGMGFERICAVLQKKPSNYDTDVFTPIFDAIQKRTGAPGYTGLLPGDGSTDPEPHASACAASPDVEPHKSACGEHTDAEDPRGLKPAAQGRGDSAQVMVDVSYRVIADHVRCLTFALTDGAVPSNEGRGYVLRRILRRAVRYGRQYMNMHDPFLADLVPALVEHMGDTFAELRTAHGGRNLDHVVELIREEEDSFGKTLDRGIALFEKDAAFAIGFEYAKANGLKLAGFAKAPVFWEGQDENAAIIEGARELEFFDENREFISRELADQIAWLNEQGLPLGAIKGADAFKLHDTYGFPIDLTELMARERGLAVDLGEYERLMNEAREKARAGSMSGTSSMHLSVSGNLTATAPLPRTDDSPKYRKAKHHTEILGWVSGGAWSTDGELSPGGDDPVALVLAETCAYAEQGGQIGDRGVIRTESGAFEFETTQRTQDSVVHIGRVTGGSIEAGQEVTLEVDASRSATMQNHTSTHILNWALREVLGDHVQQKGSLVDPEKTRFDLSHPKPISDEQLARIEKLCNEQIDAELPVYTQDVEQQKAREISTLRAVFGEKYPDVVRVVSIGAAIDEMLADPGSDKWMKYSVEFCGGTHLQTSSEAKRFVLTTEEGVAKGIRRVVGVSGETALQAEAAGQTLTAELEAIDEADLAAGLSSFQKKLSDQVIPIGVRHRLRERMAELQKKAKAQGKQAAAASGGAVMDRIGELLESAQTVSGVTVVVGDVPAAGGDALRGAIDWVRNKTDASAVLLAMASDDKVTLIAGMSKDVVGRGVKAGDLIKEVAPLVGGRGGGRPDMAQGGGTDSAGIPAAIDRGAAWITEKLS